MFNKDIETKVTIHELIAARWSGRAYDPEKIVSRKAIIALIEAARWAPSCFGDQPWRFIVFDKATNKAVWEKAWGCLAEGNQSWAKDAPLLLLACADSVLSQNGKPNRWGQYDTGAASENLCLQATALGLMVHQMGGFDADKTITEFVIPEQFTPMAMMAVGYQLPESKIPEDIKEREYNARARNTLDENFFEGHWGEPISTAV
ncbi:MAG: oxidoreductase [marine bacterium B5-7]|nr:MAG: oxidoreductase [marine bacterium B5-7]